MRQLTDIERDFLLAYWFTEPLNNSIAIPERFKEGFVAGLDFTAGQIAALEAERDALQRLTQRQSEALKILTAISERREAMIRDLIALNGQLETENTRLREALRQIAAGNPAPPGGKWLSDAKMAQIARRALKNPAT